MPQDFPRLRSVGERADVGKARLRIESKVVDGFPETRVFAMVALPDGTETEHELEDINGLAFRATAGGATQTTLQVYGAELKADVQNAEVVPTPMPAPDPTQFLQWLVTATGEQQAELLKASGLDVVPAIPMPMQAQHTSDEAAARRMTYARMQHWYARLDQATAHRLARAFDEMIQTVLALAASDR